MRGCVTSAPAVLEIFTHKSLTSQASLLGYLSINYAKQRLLLPLNLFIGLTVNLEPQIYRLQQNMGGHLVGTKTVFTSVLLLLYLTNILVRYRGAPSF
jgi:hypothetical protein